MDGLEFVNACLNDPGEKRRYIERAAPSPSVSRFDIVGWNKAGGDFPMGTYEFEWGHLGVILSRTYDVWESYFGAPFTWQAPNPLPVIARAGQELNAYYDRSALKFFYGKDVKTNEPVYTSESADIAAHECGHAVLDAQHPDYWDSLHPETGAFHEAFGDISALLTTLQFPAVRAALLKQTRGDLAESSAVSRLAEQLGQALYNARGPSVSQPNFLRDLVNTFRYLPTWQLPASALASKLSSESHSFSRVFSGAFYEILGRIYTQSRKQDKNLDADATLAKARDETGRLLAQALRLAPPGDAIFQVIAVALLKADQQIFAGKYFPILRRVFSKRHMLKVKDADTFKSHTQTIGGKTRSMSAFKIDDLDQDGRIPPEVVDKALHLRGEELIFARELGRRSNQERTVQFRAQRSLRLKGKRYGAADGVSVPLLDGLTLNVDVAGIVLASHWYRTGPQAAKAIRDHVEKLAAKDRIYDAKPGDQVDMMHLISRCKPYYIDYDAAGDKILRRAFIACGGH